MPIAKRALKKIREQKSKPEAASTNGSAAVAAAASQGASRPSNSLASGPGGLGSEGDAQNLIFETDVDLGDALIAAIRANDEERLRILLQANPQLASDVVRSPGRFPLLHWAAFSNFPELCVFLLRQGCELDARNEHGEVALHWAALEGQLSTTHLLLERGADPSLADAGGRTAVHKCVLKGHLVLLDYFRNRGMDIEAGDLNGRTPAHWAAYMGQTFCLDYLLLYTPRTVLYAKDGEGCLPLHWAAKQGKLNAVETIVKHAPDSVWTRDQLDCLPLHMTRQTLRRAKDDIREGKVVEISVRDLNRTVFQLNVQMLVQWLDSKLPGTSRVYNSITAGRIFSNWLSFIIIMGVFTAYYGTLPSTTDLVLTQLVFWMCYCGMGYFWFRAHLGAPGYITRTPKSPSPKLQDSRLEVTDDTRFQRSRRLYMEALTSGTMVNGCATCQIIKPHRSKHCRDCGVCVARFDHHCPWINNCVGEGNHRNFILMLAFTFCTVALHLTLLTSFQSRLNPEASFWNTFKVRPWFLLWCWHYLFYLLFVGLLLFFQLQLVATNITTNEQANAFRYDYLKGPDGQLRNPFDHGTSSNFKRFCFGRADANSDADDERAVELAAHYKVEHSV